MGEKGLISVIVPVYNTAEYLERCITSITENTYKNLEILCIDDGSTDNSLEVLTKIAEKDRRVRVIHQENGGISSARNHGLKEAKGEWISFVDSDDWIHKEMFSIFMDAAGKYDADIVIGKHSIVNHRDIDSDNKVSGQLLFPSSVTSLGAMVTGNLYHKRVIKDLNFPEGIAVEEDSVFNSGIKANNRDLHIVYYTDILYYQYNREGSSKTLYQWDTDYTIAKYILSRIDNYYMKKTIIADAYSHALSFRYVSSFSIHCIEAKNKSKELLKLCRGFLLNSGEFGWREKMKYLVATFSPELYRYRQIRKDPTLLTYERTLKEKAAKGEW